MSSQAHTAVTALSVGDHAVFPFTTRREQFDALNAFVKAGLDNEERVVYVSDAARAAAAREAFPEHAEDFVSGRIVLEDSSVTYMQGGLFTPARMLEHYTMAAQRARAESYAGIRVAADMSWATQSSPSLLVQYEQALNSAMAGQNALILCQYDRRLFSDELIQQLEDVHPLVVTPELLFRDAVLSIHLTSQPFGLAVNGEIDVSNRTHFKKALEQVMSRHEPVITIDLRSTRYIDARSMAAIAVTTAAFPGKRRLRVLMSARLQRLFRAAIPSLPLAVQLEVGL